MINSLTLYPLSVRFSAATVAEFFVFYPVHRMDYSLKLDIFLVVTREQAISELPVASVSKRVNLRSQSNKNAFGWFIFMEINLIFIRQVLGEDSI